MSIELPPPETQIEFAVALEELRGSHLQEALLATVGGLTIPEIDIELAKFVPSHSLALLASHGLRGELLFPVPSILTANPRLLGYYRLVYGFSQKDF